MTNPDVAKQPHSTRQDVLALRNALTILNRDLATPTASSLANEGYAALGRIEEQFEALDTAARRILDAPKGTSVRQFRFWLMDALGESYPAISPDVSEGDHTSGDSAQSGQTPQAAPSETFRSDFDPQPPGLMVDANGYVWRVYEDYYSLCPVRPEGDNDTITEPLTFYKPDIPDAVHAPASRQE